MGMGMGLGKEGLDYLSVGYVGWISRFSVVYVFLGAELVLTTIGYLRGRRADLSISPF